MAKDKLRENHALRPGKGPSPEETRVDGHDSSSQGDEIIDLTELASPEALPSGEALQTPSLTQATATPRQEFAGGSEDSEQAPPEDGAEALNPPGEEAPTPSKGVFFDDEVVEITAADLLDDEALSLAVEQTVEALDLKDSEPLSDRMTTGLAGLHDAVDVNDTLDDQFIKSLGAAPSGDSAPEPVATWEKRPAQVDDLDQLLEEMAGEINAEGAYPEKTILLEDVVQGPNWLSEGDSPGETGGAFPLSAADLEESSVAAEDRVSGAASGGMAESSDTGSGLEGAAAAGVLSGWGSGGHSGPMPSEAQLEAALERVVTKMYRQKIDGLLNRVIERTVSREILRLKEILTEDANLK